VTFRYGKQGGKINFFYYRVGSKIWKLAGMRGFSVVDNFAKVSVTLFQSSRLGIDYQTICAVFLAKEWTANFKE
jgi:hypothetical protein